MKGLRWRLLATRYCSSSAPVRSTLPPRHTESINRSAELGTHQEPLSSDSLQSEPSSGFTSQESYLLNKIQRFCKQGHPQCALDALSLLISNGFTPSENVYWSLLKTCSEQKALIPAKQVHGFLVKHGEGLSSSIFDYLVSTLAKCGGLEDALHLFHQLGPHRTVLSWTAVILAFTEGGKGHEALETYARMQDEGFQPNVYTIVSLLKACGNILDVMKGMDLHSCACMKGLDTHDFVGSALVSMYGKCGSVLEAEIVFNSLSKQNIVLWNAMLSAYAEQGDAEKIWCLHEKLLAEGTEPNERTFVMLIQACCMLSEKEEAVMVDGMPIKVKSLTAGRQLQASVGCKGLTANVFVGNNLIIMFGKCWSIVEAESVFSQMSDYNVISWTAMLSAYNEQDEAEKALQLFAKMHGDCVSPNEWTFSIALQACCLLVKENEFYSEQGWKSKDLPLDIGRSLHADAKKKGYDVDACIGSMLVNLYGKCGSIHEAVSVFDGLPSRDVTLWNAILSAYVEQKYGDTVLHLYKRMQQEGVSPDEQTSIVALQGCSVLAAKEESVVIQGRPTKKISLEIGRALHADAKKMGFDRNIYLGSTLVSMYGKCGSIVDAENVFGGLPDCDVVSWTAMIAAYGEQSLVQKALDLYLKMQDKDVIMDDGTIVSLVQACRETGTLDLCRQIHFDILASRGDPSLLLTTAFIHAYGTCTSMADAWAVFDVLLEPDVVSWSALVTGYAKDGNFTSSFVTFERMKGAGIEPNEVTFLSLLSTCSHAGLVNKGVEFFESMDRTYGVMPKIDHFVTVVDLLGRVGELERAEDMLSRMPGQPDLAMWLCLLGACEKHGNLALGKRVFSHAIKLHPDKASAYVMMSKIYSNFRLWVDTSEVD